MLSNDRYVDVYEQLIHRGFSQNEETKIAASYMAQQPEENLLPLLDRMSQITEFCQDEVSNSILAASYYGMEELRMRIPRLEETLVNPFGTGRAVSLLSGTILIADGGPAEGAKAMQLYLQLMRKGVNLKNDAILRMLGLLCVLTVSPVQDVNTIMGIVEKSKLEDSKAENTKKEHNGESIGNIVDITTLFAKAACIFVEELLEDAARQEQLGENAQSLLQGMELEVRTIIEAVRAEV